MRQFMKVTLAWLLVVLLLFVGIFSMALADVGPGGGEEPNAPPVTDPDRVYSGSHGTPDKILLITLDGNGTWAPNSLNLYANLVALGYTVTHLYNPPSGSIASTLAAQTFQQVWLFDITTSLQISTSDAAAIAAWYSANSKGNIIIDARSYGSWYTPIAELPLTANYAHAFSLRCGGLWIGTDHSPEWAFNGNAVLSAMGYGNVSGIHYGVTVATPVPTHELLTNPNVINLGNVHAFASPGVSPTGIQADGTVLQTLLFNSQNANPLVSFALESNYCEPKAFKCPLTQGFWKNHPEAWPVTSLTLGSQTYTQAELLTILNTPTKGDASLILAYQLIAAKLNIANGSDPAPVSGTIATADGLLNGFPAKLPYGVRPSSTTGQAMISAKDVLDSYNNGQLTPGCIP